MPGDKRKRSKKIRAAGWVKDRLKYDTSRQERTHPLSRQQSLQEKTIPPDRQQSLLQTIYRKKLFLRKRMPGRRQRRFPPKTMGTGRKIPVRPRAY